ncbi:MAG: DUF115 domain-containing protein [Treponema sp.]|jgi:hypothetical protein|nr:DUF115 domain-containing protein [Treponema sp.]
MSGAIAPALHSRYNPQGEAEKYLNALELGAETEYFILIEPGLGYLIPPLKKKRPAAKIIALHVDNAFQPAAREEAVVPAWFPGGPVSLQQFLENEIPDLEARQIRIIEWRPSLRVYGEAYLRLLSETAEFIKRIDANARTVRGFGGRWVNNFFKNLRLLRFLLTPEPFDGPLVITGSGPSLETAIPLIGELKNLRVLAASSSVKALVQGGIIPGMVLSADGGGWALCHLYECFRCPNQAPPLAVNLSAALPSQCSRLPIMTLDDGSLWQRTVLRGLGIPSLTVPQRGTVSASALDLALALCSGNIVIAGLDLSLRDIRTHVRPYGFDPIFWGKASRFTPLYAQMFSRAGGIRRGGSHRIYAAWFSRQAASWPDRIFSLGNNSEAFHTLKPWVPGEGGQVKKGTFSGKKFGEPAPAPGGINAGQGTEILIRALAVPALAAPLTGELAPLLFPGRKTVQPEELAEPLRSIGEHYG